MMPSSNAALAQAMRRTETDLCAGTLIPWTPAEVMSLAEAAVFLGRSKVTTRKTVAKYGLGRHRPGATVQSGTWSVSRVALTMFSEGDFVALTAYHRGVRSEDPVRAYYDRMRIAPPVSRSAA